MKKVIKFLPLVGAVLAIVALLVFCLGTTLTYTAEQAGIKAVASVGGFSMIFGGDVTIKTVATASGNTLNRTDTITCDKGFNTIGFIAFLLLIIGAIVAVLPVFVGALKGKKVVSYVAAGLILVAAILIFCSKNSALAVIANGDKDALSAMKDDSGYKLGAGPIVGGILAILGAGSVGAAAVLDK